MVTSNDQPSPFVYWAQDANVIFLKVDLRDIKDQNVQLESKSMEMSAYGVGARGASKYAFKLDFYNDIASEDEVHSSKVTDRVVEFTLKKKFSGFWPRLIKHQQKPAWLKVDFDRWKSEDDDLSDSEIKKDVMSDYSELHKNLSKQEIGYIKEDFKKVYLFFYNLIQFVFFSYILIVIAIRYSRDGADCIPGTYEAVGSVLKFAQLLQFLEVMHPMFGYTKGSIFLPFLQVTGRCITLFPMIEAEPRIQDKLVVFLLICCWAAIEVVRYPYYICGLYKTSIGLLTWLRYTLWIPLYPLGLVCEGIIMLRNIPYYEETQRYVISMPNSWNVTFHPPTLMKLYLMILFIPGGYALICHMYRIRVRKISRRRLKLN